MSKYWVISGPYFPAFGLNTEKYLVSLRIQSECGKIRTRNNSVFGHFHAVINKKNRLTYFMSLVSFFQGVLKETSRMKLAINFYIYRSCSIFFVVDFEHTFAQRVRTNMNSSYWPHLPMMFLGKAMRVLKRNTGKKWLKKCSNQNCTLLCNFFENDFYKYESGEKTDKNNQQTSYNFPTLCCTH